jgi:hypothetical protein
VIGTRTVLRQKRWVFAVVAAGVALLAIDWWFRTAVSPRSSDSDRVVTIASGGFLNGRRAVHLICSPVGQARIVVSADFADATLHPGAKANGRLQVAAGERRGKPDVDVAVLFSVSRTGWVDTLTSDPLPGDVLAKVAEGLRNPSLDFVAVHGFEHGIYFWRSGMADLRPQESCLPR